MPCIEILVEEHRHHDEGDDERSSDGAFLEKKDRAENDLSDDHADDRDPGEVEPEPASRVVGDGIDVNELILPNKLVRR